MIELLNSLLYQYFHEDGKYQEVDYSFLSSLSEIIVRPKIHLEAQIYRTRTRINACYVLARDFLGRLDPRYGEYLEEKLMSGCIHFYDRDENGATGLSHMIGSSEGNTIEFYETGTIEDAYTFSHECMHSWNCHPNQATESWHLMTECLSILAESLQQDDMQIRARSYPEYRKNKRDTYYALRTYALTLQFEIQLLEFYQEFGYIDDTVLFHMLDQMTDEAREAALDDLNWIDKEEELQIWMLPRYVVGGVLASHMHQRILECPQRLQEFIELNDYCQEMEFLDILRYLDLEVVDESIMKLSSESQKVLQKNYIKELRNL